MPKQTPTTGGASKFSVLKASTFLSKLNVHGGRNDNRSQSPPKSSRTMKWVKLIIANVSKINERQGFSIAERAAMKHGIPIMIASLLLTIAAPARAADDRAAACKPNPTEQRSMPKDAPVEVFGNDRRDCFERTNGSLGCWAFAWRSGEKSFLSNTAIVRQHGSVSLASKPACSTARVHRSSFEQKNTKNVPTATLELQSLDGGLASIAGSVRWSMPLLAPRADEPPEPAIRARIVIADREFILTLSRNIDKELPASHVVEIAIGNPETLPYGGIEEIPGIVMQYQEAARGKRLAATSVRVTDGYFMMGLSNINYDQAANLTLLKEADTMKIPIIYRNGKRALLTIEKGPAGQRVFDEALSAWVRNPVQRGHRFQRKADINPVIADSR